MAKSAESPSHMGSFAPSLFCEDVRREKAGTHRLLSMASQQLSQVSGKNHHIGAD